MDIGKEDNEIEDNSHDGNRDCLVSPGDDEDRLCRDSPSVCQQKQKEAILCFHHSGM